MSKISWGKPIVEIRSLTEDEGSDSNWILLSGAVKETAILTTENVNKLNVSEESGGIVDSRTEKGKYVFEFELYKTKGLMKPIPDDDGIIETEYSIRLTPEDPTNEGWLMKRASVSVEDTWAANIGHKWKYTFEALKPNQGKLLEPYNAVKSVRFLSGFVPKFIKKGFRFLN
jgi:hypothetical protein